MGFVAILFLIYTYNIYRKRLNIEKKNKFTLNELEAAPVENVVGELKEETESITLKITDGLEFLNKLNIELTKTDNVLKSIDAGVLPPTFAFNDRESLKEKITACQSKQLSLIQSGRAITALSDWTWENSRAKGQEMLVAYNYLTLKAFNTEFDAIRKQMRHASIDTATGKLSKLDAQLGKLGETANVMVSSDYYDLKIDELFIWYEELVHREHLKQDRKAQQALLRKQGASKQDESEDIEDDLYYKKSDLKKAQSIAQELHGNDEVNVSLEIQKIKQEILELEKKRERALSQAQITKAGYIYVISNLGCFGEGVVKIGMTRRLEPMDRVHELGDASVAFKFDVHTMAFVENAPTFEKKLHHKFHDYRVNTENNRKEFFKVSPQEVQLAMAEMGIDSDWFFDVEAKEYRESLLMRKANLNRATKQQSKAEQLPAFI